MAKREESFYDFYRWLVGFRKMKAHDVRMIVINRRLHHRNVVRVAIASLRGA